LGEPAAEDSATSEYVQVSTPDRPPVFVRANDFDEAAAELQKLIDWAKAAGHRVGYFAAVYKRVTLALQKAADHGAFQEAGRMSELAGVFASRYLESVNAFFHPGEGITSFFNEFEDAKVSRSWQASFNQFDNDRPVIVQHIQAGINAHAAFDLGMAVNFLTGSQDVDAVRDDYFAVNAVLASQTDDLLDMVEEISPGLKAILDTIPGNEARLIGPAIAWMRQDSWGFVKVLEFIPGMGELKESPIEYRDDWVFVITSILFGGLLSTIFDLIGLTESRDVTHNIEILDGAASRLPDEIKTTL
jgi:hypothetical protein